MDKLVFILASIGCTVAFDNGLSAPIRHLNVLQGQALKGITCESWAEDSYPTMHMTREDSSGHSTTITNSTDPGRIHVFYQNMENFKTKATLDFTAIELNDAAVVYVCNAVFKRGAIGKTFHIEVEPDRSIPVIQMSVPPMTAVNESAILHCNATSWFKTSSYNPINPELFINWYYSHEKDSYRYLPSRTEMLKQQGVQRETYRKKQNFPDYFTLEIQDRLILDPVQYANAGYYICKVTLKWMEIKNYTYEKETYLHVNGTGSTTRYRSEVIVTSGSSVNLTCPFIDVPKSTTQWVKDGSNINENSHYAFHDEGDHKGKILSITDVSSNDTKKEITCIAFDRITMVVKRFDLKMQDSPSAGAHSVTLSAYGSVLVSVMSIFFAFYGI